MEKHRLAAIMFTDIVGYTQLMGQDEENALLVLKQNRKIHESTLKNHQGQLLKEIGDGMLCSFDAATDAVDSAIDLIRHTHHVKGLKLRIGIHIGEVIFSDHDVIGDGVNISSRIQAIAVPDSVLLSGKVYEEVRNKKKYRLKQIGEFHLKNDVKNRIIFAVVHAGLKVPTADEYKDIRIEPNRKEHDENQYVTQLEAPELQKRNKWSLSTPRIGLTVLFSLMAMAFGSFLFISFRNTTKVKWAREEAIIKIEQLIEQEKFKQAFHLAEEAEKYIPNDPLLTRLWPNMQYFLNMDTDPSGAHVYRKLIGEPDTEYEYIGMTPLDSIRTYRRYSSWKIVKEGYDPFEYVGSTWNLNIRLFETGELPKDMLYVPFYGWWSNAELTGLGDIEKPELRDYLIDQYEVTNEAFKEFLDQGGYDSRVYWKEPIIKNGDQLSWEEAMEYLVDKTGQPGPSTWEVGDYPTGQDDYPVSGVSWYEALAYAEFAGKQIPSVFHWMYAATPGLASKINPYSNFSENGIAPKGQYKGLGMFGTYDMSGNVREWCVNLAEGKEDRFILGGAWSDAPYNASLAQVVDPMDRSSINGFRCIQYTDTIENEPVITAKIPLYLRDYSKEEPVADDMFQFFLRQFDYPKTPFNSHSTQETLENQPFICEKVEIDNAYDDAQISMYIFLPSISRAPYQTVVYFPESSAFDFDDFYSNMDWFLPEFDFYIKSGRAVIFPVLNGTFYRSAITRDLPLVKQVLTVIEYWILDARRIMDYLVTRPDINTETIAYHGYSTGALIGGNILAVEKRFKTAVLLVGGLPPVAVPTELDQIHYLPRVTVPILMLNGKYDDTFPYTTSSKPMYERLGTPEENKKQIVYDVGHSGPTKYDLIRESLFWLDKYQGKVQSVN